MTSLSNCIMLSKVVIGDDPQYFHVMMIPNKSERNRSGPLIQVGTFRTALVRNPALKFPRVQRISPKTAMVYSKSPRTPGFINKNSFFFPLFEAPDVVSYHIPRMIPTCECVHTPTTHGPRTPMRPPHLELGNCGISNTMRNNRAALALWHRGRHHCKAVWLKKFRFLTVLSSEVASVACLCHVGQTMPSTYSITSGQDQESFIVAVRRLALMKS
jgi:hypothetical protein